MSVVQLMSPTYSSFTTTFPGIVDRAELQTIVPSAPVKAAAPAAAPDVKSERAKPAKKTPAAKKMPAPEPASAPAIVRPDIGGAKMKLKKR
jgi:hypothetical protein